MSPGKELIKGFYTENPVFRLMLGLCPVLATSTSVNNGIGMGAATLFVLVCSNVVISLIRKAIPAKIRIPIFIMIIATFVTIVDLVMAGFFPELHESLGIFISLIVVNCIILGRAEAYASKNNVFYAFIDGLGMGLGFTLSMILISSIREILGNGTWLGLEVFGSGYNPVLLMILSPGAFFTIGLLMSFLSWFEGRRSSCVTNF
ncbi:MAG TPA: electron transport complex subunit E [bacterium]|nr:electron transport complex subunit E [bacterium]